MEVDTQAQKFDTTLQYRLVPMTSEPLSFSRYKSSCYVQPASWVITQGPICRSSTSPAPKWRHLIHPEGKPYFVLTGEFPFDIITEANIEDEQTQGRIHHCITMADNELHRSDIKLPPRCELFLELAGDGVCNYYFVDHTEKRLFWLEELCTEVLYIPAAVSGSHLETEIQRLYWTHVEYFPMHHESDDQQFRQIVDDLCNIVSHGQVDRLTSRGSTFPFTVENCRDILKLLLRKRGQSVDGYTLCGVARLAGAIEGQRFATFYGQQPAKLDRLQEVYFTGVVQHKWLSTVANLLMWGIPKHYTSLLYGTYVDETVYRDQWARFIATCLGDWETSLSWSFPVVIGSLLLANVGGGTISASVPSVLSCTVGIISASYLHLRHQPLAESDAAAGVHYLSLAKSRTVGFLLSSVALSLPRASCVWGMVLFMAQFLFVASQSVDRLVALVAASLVAALTMFMLLVTCPEAVPTTSFFQSVVSLCDPRSYSLCSREAAEMV